MAKAAVTRLQQNEESYTADLLKLAKVGKATGFKSPMSSLLSCNSNVYRLFEVGFQFLPEFQARARASNGVQTGCV